MKPETVTRQTTTNNLKRPNKKLIKSEKVQCSEADYILNTYDVEGYGEALYVQEEGRTDGEFRKERAMIPFEFIGMKPKDFIWGSYECNIEAQKKIANAFIINFEKFEANGKGLYIYSKKKGSGKTMLSCCLLNELIDTKPINAKFITVLDFIELTKKGFKFDTCSEEVDAIFGTRLLVLDDIGAQMKKEWVDTVLYRLINYRMSKKLVTVFTSNIAVNELKIDERISERIFKMTIPLILPDVSIRNKKAQEENAAFMKEII